MNKNKIKSSPPKSNLKNYAKMEPFLDVSGARRNQCFICFNDRKYRPSNAKEDTAESSLL